MEQLRTDSPRNLHENCFMQLYVKMQATPCHCTAQVTAQPSLLSPKTICIHSWDREAGGGMRLAWGLKQHSLGCQRLGRPFSLQCAPGLPCASNALVVILKVNICLIGCHRTKLNYLLVPLNYFQKAALHKPGTIGAKPP